jgi:uncharacterized membrane protein
MINTHQLKISFDLALVFLTIKMIYKLYKTADFSLFSTGWLLLTSGNWLITIILATWYICWITLIIYLFFRILNFLIAKFRS